MQFLEEALFRPAVFEKKKFQAGAFAVLAQPVAVAKDLGDSLQHGQNLMRQNKRVHAPRQVWIGRKATGDPERESHLIAMFSATVNGCQANIIDLGIGAPDRASGDANLELA